MRTDIKTHKGAEPVSLTYPACRFEGTHVTIVGALQVGVGVLITRSITSHPILFLKSLYSFSCIQWIGPPSSPMVWIVKVFPLRIGNLVLPIDALLHLLPTLQMYVRSLLISDPVCRCDVIP